MSLHQEAPGVDRSTPKTERAVLKTYAGVLAENPKNGPQIREALRNCGPGQTINGMLDDGRPYSITNDSGETRLEVAPKTAQA